jgi:S-adenosylmethionine:tRNA-ribosyltransferase-isomerase (queuine synthetase)
MKKGDVQNIKISDFNYTLPDEKIAKYPLPQRDSSKLLIYKDSQLSSSNFSSLPDQLPGNSLLIFNNTRVIHAWSPYIFLIFNPPTQSTSNITLEPSLRMRSTSLLSVP